MLLLDYITWTVGPDIISIGPLTLRWYGLLFATGFLVGYYMMEGMFKQEGKPLAALDSLTIYMVLATVIGARLGHCLFYEPAEYLREPWRILYVWEGGLASHGAAVGILFALWLFARRHAKDGFTYLWVVDRIVITVAFAAVCIRLGNFFNHEIVGAPTTLPWGVLFTREQLDLGQQPVPRHPAQIYEAAFYLLSFFLLRWQYRRYREKTPAGYLLGMFLLLIFGSRIFMEMLKKEQVAFEKDMALNMGQLLSIPLVLVGLWLLWRGYQQLPKTGAGA